MKFILYNTSQYLYDSGAFEHIFCPGGGEFEKPDLKVQIPGVCPGGGDVEASNWWVHQSIHCKDCIQIRENIDPSFHATKIHFNIF